jgi:hypothetical protein
MRTDLFNQKDNHMHNKPSLQREPSDEAKHYHNQNHNKIKRFKILHTHILNEQSGICEKCTVGTMLSGLHGSLPLPRRCPLVHGRRSGKRYSAPRV